MSQSTVSCPLCAKPSALAFKAPDYNRRLSSELFDYYRCPGCGLIFLHPVPPDLGKFYPKNYYCVPPSVKELEAAIPVLRYKMDIIGKFVTAGRFLEIGPAVGDLALQAKQAGFDVDVIEMDADCCEYLTKHVGVRAICSMDTAGALRKCGTYNVIALWHVIEHLTDLWDVLAVAASRLNPGGILVMAAPNPQAFQFRMLRKRWAHVDAPRHVMLIPVDLLIKQVEKHGLTAVFQTTDDDGAIGWNKFGWERSLENLATGKKLKQNLRGLGRWLWRRTERWERREGRGSAYTVVFQKPKGGAK